jgi:YVTN family beta-propeller protein
MIIFRAIQVALLSLILMDPLMSRPVVTSVSPTNGLVESGNVVEIRGRGFKGATAVDFGFRPSTTFEVISDSSITATVPVGTAGTVDVRVKISKEVSFKTREDFYTYTKDSWDGIVSGKNPAVVKLFDTALYNDDGVISLPAQSTAAVITPDGTTIYAADSNQPQINVIDVATLAVVKNIPNPIGGDAFDLIVSPDGKNVYVSSNVTGYVTVVDTKTNTIDDNIFVFTNLGPLSITPDGKTVYVSNFSTSSVTPIDTQTHVVGAGILTGLSPGMISITPDGKQAYVANLGSDTVTIIRLSDNTVTGSITFPSGAGPYGSSILPNGKFMYVANIGNDTVSVVDLSNNHIVGSPLTFPAGSQPFWVASTPDSSKVYVITQVTNLVTPIRVSDNSLGVPFAHTPEIQDIVMSPDPTPVASFFVEAQPPGTPTIFNASGSISPIGTISNYMWDFGDGVTLSTTAPVVSHTYQTDGPFKVVLTVTNSAGTSTLKVFSSRFMSNNGGLKATVTQTIDVGLFPPADLKGEQQPNEFLFQSNVFNKITWKKARHGATPILYIIYRDKALQDPIGVVSATEPLVFEDQNIKKGLTYTYFVVAEANNGVSSAPAVVTVKSL